MRYKSTRNNEKFMNSSFAILHGLANDGWLYVPESLPKLDLSYEFLKDMSYQEIAFYVLKNFFTNLKEEDLKASINSAYSSETFSDKEIAPLVNINSEVSFTELFHGRTHAFKDLALSLFPYLIVSAKKSENEKNEILILTATSGDTGKAALEGFKDIEGIKIIVFYPKNGVSPMQEDQMRKQLGNNVDIISIDGNFDDAQGAVKRIFSSDHFKKILNENNTIFSSANSINIGRLFPQVVYYITTYINLCKKNIIKPNEKFNVVVPTGNFGNILAAYIAKKMGIPINMLISASNENNVLSDFFKTGTYSKNRSFFSTVSPSMDVLLPSNFERYLYYITGEDSNRINELMNDLETKDSLSISEKEFLNIQKEFFGDYASNEETINSIKELYKTNNYLMDPHTAVGYNVWKKYINKTNDSTHTVIMSTAHPYKFPTAINSALEISTAENPYDLLDAFVDSTKITLPKQLVELKNLPIRFSTNIDKNDIEAYVEGKIKNKK